LNLSDDQKTQIKKIHEEARAKRDKVMADSSLSDTAKQEKAKEIRHAAIEQARSVLTPEQREQLKANRSAGRAERSPSPSL
jgi:Spy/CpxP family protein refolding chaperone